MQEFLTRGNANERYWRDTKAACVSMCNANAGSAPLAQIGHQFDCRSLASDEQLPYCRDIPVNLACCSSVERSNMRRTAIVGRLTLLRSYPMPREAKGLRRSP